MMVHRVDGDPGVVHLSSMAPSSPVLIGVVGDSGSGKTTLSLRIAQAAGISRTTLICLDDYHRYGRAERERRVITALDPACNKLDLVAEHLAALRRGDSITKPVYDHHDGTFGPDEVVTPREVIVVRGLLGLHTEALAQSFDLSVFLDPDPALRVEWKIERDCAKRGYSRDQVMAQIEQRRPDADLYIAPQRERADMVIRFTPAQPRRTGDGVYPLHMRITLRGSEARAASGAGDPPPGVARTPAGQRVVPVVLSAAAWARDAHGGAPPAGPVASDPSPSSPSGSP
jgi:phosphoribulokinase